MSVFTRRSGYTASELSNKQQKVLGTFRKAMNDLGILNEEIERQEQRNLDELNRLSTEQSQLKKAKSDNQIVIDNIGKLIGVGK